MSFYVNGQLVGNCTLGMGKGTEHSYANAPTKLGWFGATSDNLGVEWLSFGQRAMNHNFNGLLALDDFALYDRVLLGSEVQQKYAETAAFDPSTEQGLALYYSFNDVTGGTVSNAAPSTQGTYDLYLGETPDRAADLSSGSSSSCGTSGLTSLQGLLDISLDILSIPLPPTLENGKAAKKSLERETS